MNLEKHIAELHKDVHPQRADPGHTAWAEDVIKSHIKREFGIRNVLDVGCGEGFCAPAFKSLGMVWEGVSWDQEDIDRGESKGITIKRMDMSFLDYRDNSFDLIFARHTLEHSPMPLITLLEWYRVSRKYLLVVLPSPDYWGIKGLNHYFVLPKDYWWYLFERAGWLCIRDIDFLTTDKRFEEFHLPDKPPPQRKWVGPPKVVEYRLLFRKRHDTA